MRLEAKYLFSAGSSAILNTMGLASKLAISELLIFHQGGNQMNKLNYSDIQDLQLIDIRSQKAYQSGHAKGSLNFNPSNFKKYAAHFLTSDQAIVLVIDDASEANLEELHTTAQEMGYTQIKGYILASEIPAEDTQIIETITVGDLLKQDGDYTLLDLRSPGEIARPAPEKNLVNIPLENLTADYSSLDTGKTIYTLCGSGNRATTAASYLIEKGYTPVVVEGGMKAVQAATL